jgi:SAM-dependent methyltransferase
MTDITYTHGHHDSVLRSHRWRTAENSAHYLLASLRPGMSLLDVGCGPGTITSDLARLVSPGPVTGIDASAEVIAEASASAEASGMANLSFEVGSVFDLPREDDSVDVVHAHQLLQHVGDPVAALAEMKRVCRPGGLVAARDSDYPTFTFYPTDPELTRCIAAYGQLTRVNGANWDAGRRLLHWANQVGFTSVSATASTWCFASPEDRAWWGGLWADRFTESSMATQLVDHGIASATDLESFAGAWRSWSESDDGWFALIHGEVIAVV